MKHVTAFTYYFAPVKQEQCGCTSKFSANSQSAVEFLRCEITHHTLCAFEG